MAKFTANDIIQKNSEKTQFTAYDILALQRDRESAQRQRDVERELNPIQMPSQQKVNTQTTTKRTELTPLSLNAGNQGLSPFQTNMIAPTIQRTNVALSQPKNNLDQLSKFTAPDYKLSDAEKEQAKKLIKEFQDSQKKVWSPSDPKRTEEESAYANKIYLLQNKMNPVASFTMGLIDSFPTTGLTKWVAEKLGASEAVEPFNQTSEVTKQASPVAYTAGDIAGSLAQYGVGAKVAQGIKPIAYATQKAGQALAKLPILSKVGAQPIANVLGDMTLDVALDTIPEVASNIKQGESAGAVVGDIAKNLGLNLALNIGGEALGTVLGKLAKKRSAKEIEKLLTDAINSTSKEELPTVLEQVTKQALNEPIEALESVSKNLDTVTNVAKTEVPTLNSSQIQNIPASNVDDVAKAVTEKPLVMAEDTGFPKLEQTVTQKPISETWTMKERGYAESIREKTDLPDAVKQEFIDSPELYTQLSNKTTRETAENIMATNDISKSEDIYRELLGKKDAVSIPLGYNIAKSYADAGDINKSVDILREMSKELTSAGQFSQAAAIYLMRSNPMTALRYFEKDLEGLNKKGFEKFGKKWNDIKLTEDEMKAFADMPDGDTEGIKKLYQQIYDRIRKEIPSTTWEKFVELTKVSMLLNTRTQIRNVLSNALLLPVSSLSNKVSALGQNAVSMVAKDFKPTQSVIVSKDSKKLSEQAWNTVKDTILKDSDKWTDVKGAMRDRQVFKGSKASQFIDTVTGGAITKANRLMGKETNPSTLETLRNLTYYLLEKGDDVFVKKNFENRLASFMQARNIKSLDDIPEEAYTIATLEAMKATFKDTNRLTDMFSSIKKSTGKVGEVLLPFTKTPANLAVRSYEYSPASIVKTFNNIKAGDVPKLMDDLAKTFVGTAGIGLGAYLFNKGIITGDYSTDPDEAAFQKQQGYVPYAVKVGDSYVTYDWAQPAASSLLIGTAIAQGIDEESKVLDNVVSAGTTAANQWMELSPLQSVADIFGGYGTPAENFLNEVVEFPQRLVPSALGSTARTVDTTQRSTYSKDDMLGTQLNTLKSKIPVLSKTLPATYDTWGREVKRSDSTGQAAIAQFLNPGTLGNANVSPIDNEISRLYTETGSNKVFPKKAERTIKVGEETTNLDNRQYSEYQKSLGEKSYTMAERFINSDAYKNMPADTSADVLEDIYSFANALAKEDMTDYDASSVSTFKKPYEVYKSKGLEGVVDYLTLKSNLNSSKASDIFGAVSNSGLSKEDMGYYLGMLSSDSSGKDKVKAKYGNTGLYDFYSIKSTADADANGTIAKGELINYFNQSELTRMEKKFYYELLVSAKNNPYN